MPKPYEIKRMTIDPVNWTPVIPTRECNRIILSRGAENDAYVLRSDQTDATTEKVVGLGMEQAIICGPGSFNPAFTMNSPAVYVRAFSTAGTIIAEFVR